MTVRADGHAAACHRLDAAARQPVTGVTLTARREPTTPILEVSNLSIAYGQHRVVHDLCFDVLLRECLAIVGESGSGKTTLARSIVGLQAREAGTVTFEGEVLPVKARARSNDHRRGIQFVFQNPYASLNPRRTISDILTKPITHFQGIRGRHARELAAAALARVAVPHGVLDRYPRHLSGGERQRVAIARALVCEPRILVCDEITSALDVSVQAAVVELLGRLRDDHDLSIVFVTHNLALVRTIADRVVVLHRGHIVESGAVVDVMSRPSAPYTQQLLNDTPSLRVASNAHDDRARHARPTDTVRDTPQ